MQKQKNIIFIYNLIYFFNIRMCQTKIMIFVLIAYYRWMRYVFRKLYRALIVIQFLKRRSNKKNIFLCSCAHAFAVFIEKNVIWSNNRSYLFKADRWSRQYKVRKSHIRHLLFAYFPSRVLRVLFVLGLETRQHCKVPTDRARQTELRIGCAFDPQTISSRTIETKQRQRRVRRKCVRWSCVTGRLPQKDTGPWNPVSSCECVQGKREFQGRYDCALLRTDCLRSRSLRLVRSTSSRTRRPRRAAC